MKKILIFISVVFLFSANIEYVIPLQKTKQAQINNSLLLAQYVNDLEKLYDILNLLYKNESFKEATESAEMNFKTNRSLYTVEYINMLIKLLKGECKGGGYIQDMRDKFSFYKRYLLNFSYKDLLSYDMDVLEKRIKSDLVKLDKNLKEEKNIKPLLKDIFLNLILALEEVEKETLKLKRLKIIHPFSKYEDEKYCLPKNLAQLDNKTTLVDIINFVLNGDKSLRIYGIKTYYEMFYKNDLKPFVIFH